ncbi:DUF2087 domain-containing protein [Nitriliruptor sp.]|uniref:DUF2087 domain-containing protein n=1 Tax=Nitriliruptor sp. TaxID=2448056 RepID=UPI0034A0661F
MPVLPVKRSKRLVVLARLALEFEPGERYLEPKVDRRLGRFNRISTCVRSGLMVAPNWRARWESRTEQSAAARVAITGVAYWLGPPRPRLAGSLRGAGATPAPR